VGPCPPAQAIGLTLPAPGTMVHISRPFTPALLQGVIVHPENLFKFNFIIYRGDRSLSNIEKKAEYTKLIKYFLASLAVPDDHQWVNLSPYEKDRMIKDDFGKTQMGRDLLAQDYMLKQITASLIYPKDKLGQEFWDKVYTKAYQQFGTTNIPVNTFNKVWIVPDDAVVFEKDNMAYCVKNHLKVMLEEDYLSLSKHVSLRGGEADAAISNRTINSVGIATRPAVARNDTRTYDISSIRPFDAHTLSSQVIRQIILPALEKEINEGQNFATLRQVFSGVVLAAWYKRELKESFLGKVYMNKSRLKGVDQDPRNNQFIYRQYLRAFKKGVFNLIKEDVDKYSNETIPRKYFSGGTVAQYDAEALSIVSPTSVQLTVVRNKLAQEDMIEVVNEEVKPKQDGKAPKDHAMFFNFRDKTEPAHIKIAQSSSLKSSIRNVGKNKLEKVLSAIEQKKKTIDDFKGLKAVYVLFASIVILWDLFFLPVLASISPYIHGFSFWRIALMALLTPFSLLFNISQMAKVIRKKSAERQKEFEEVALDLDLPAHAQDLLMSLLAYQKGAELNRKDLSNNVVEDVCQVVMGLILRKKIENIGQPEAVLKLLGMKPRMHELTEVDINENVQDPILKNELLAYFRIKTINGLPLPYEPSANLSFLDSKELPIAGRPEGPQKSRVLDAAMKGGIDLSQAHWKLSVKQNDKAPGLYQWTSQDVVLSSDLQGLVPVITNIQSASGSLLLLSILSNH